MEPTWQPPEPWLKEGLLFSALTHLKTGPWTTLLAAKQTGGPPGSPNGDVIIKTFSVLPGIHEDPKRISTEREKFLRSAYLQKSLTDPAVSPATSAKGWVKIFKIAEDPDHPSFTMEKCGPSLADLQIHHVNLTGKDFYVLVHSVLDALIELKTRASRSHGNLKISDVLSPLPGQNAPYKLADPIAKGEEHSANDLYSLGQILFKLIENKDWDPMVPILPTSHWDRFGPRRDRWIAFCNLLLSPNGCHDSLAEVKKEAARLKPVSPLRSVYIGMVGLALIAAGAGGYHFILGKMIFGTPQAASQPIGDPTVHIMSAEPDPQTKAAYETASQNYKTLHTKWLAIPQTLRYDHIQSRKLAQASRAILPDQIILSDPASYTNAADFYTKATAKLQEAITQLDLEETAGRKQDSTIVTDYQNAQIDYNAAQSAWNDAVKKFTPGADHTHSTALADAATLKKIPAPSDLTEFHAGADQYRLATTKFHDALALVPDEEKVALEQMDAHAAFENSRKRYEDLKTRWDAMPADPDLDLTQAKATADAGRKLLPDQFVLTDPASFRAAAKLYQDAAKKFDEAFALVDKAKGLHIAQESDAGTAIAKADQALKTKNYPEAFNYYRQAADKGSAPAMRMLGILCENGHGTTKSATDAAAWYLKAANAGDTIGMTNLAYFYRHGLGVDKDFRAALNWDTKAANGGNASAMCDIGSLYENGQGVDRDYEQAINWYLKAAAAGDRVAMDNIGVFYEKGKGVTIDYVAAMQWYTKSAAKNYNVAMDHIGALYDNGHGTPINYPQAMIWYKKAAALDYAPAICNVGTLYDNGEGVALDHVEAMKWYKLAADKNFGLAMYNIGVLYEAGRGVAVDVPEALTWYRRAIQSDDDNAKKLAMEHLDKLGYSH